MAIEWSPAEHTVMNEPWLFEEEEGKGETGVTFKCKKLILE